MIKQWNLTARYSCRIFFFISSIWSWHPCTQLQQQAGRKRWSSVTFEFWCPRLDRFVFICILFLCGKFTNRLIVLSLIFQLSVVWPNYRCLTVVCRKVEEHLEKFSKQMHFQLMCFHVDKRWCVVSSHVRILLTCVLIWSIGETRSHRVLSRLRLRPPV